MIRLLMAGTALSALLVTGALAQSSSSAMMDSSSMMSSSAMTDTTSSSAMTDTTSSSAMTDTSAMTSSSAMAPSEDMSASTPQAANPNFTILSGYTQVSTDRLASTVIGAHVFDGSAQNSNDLGKINDLVLNQNGSIAAVVVGVGGFLGIGEKQVAVDYHALQWEVGPDNNRRFVLQTTKDELTSAPDFKTVSPDQASGANASGNGAMGTSSATGMDANGNATASSSAQ